MAVSTKRNALIELYRFVFAFMVVMVHSHGFNPPQNYPFKGGYVAVEFFLIIAGYYITKSCINSEENIGAGKFAVRYTFSRYLKWLPTILVVCLIHYVYMYFFAVKEPKNIFYMVYEIMLLPQSGIYKTFEILPLWYLSAFLICVPIIAYLLKKKSDFFYNIGTIIIPLLIYGYICRTNADLDTWNDYTVVYSGVLRAFAGLCMGVNCYKLSKALSPIYSAHKKLLNILSVVVMLFVIAYTYFFSFTYADYFLCFAGMCSLAVVMNMPVQTEKTAPHIYIYIQKLFCLLGRFSFPLYCSHWTVRAALRTIYPDINYWDALPIYLILSAAYALVVMLASGLIKRAFTSFSRRRKMVWSKNA